MTTQQTLARPPMHRRPQTTRRTALVSFGFAVAIGTAMRLAGGEAPGVAPAAVPDHGHSFNVRDFGAVGDGAMPDTAAINDAMEACSKSGGGLVQIPPGRFVSGTIHLRSHVTLALSAGAELIGTTNLSQYEAPKVPSFMPEAKWGRWHRALIIGEGLDDTAIVGPGRIDGNKVFDPDGEEHMRGPHTIAFVNCHGFSLRDIEILDSANYAVFFQVSDAVEMRNLRITGGWDGIHFRGAPGHWCHDVNIIGCQFATGDDSIAGRYWDNVVISGCMLNSSCNGIRLIGPATHLIVNDCLFYGPGTRRHRTSARANMLSGIVLQPGAWDKTEGLLDDVLISHNTMRAVASPVTVWTKAGNPVGRVTISGLDATGVYRAALSVESWSDLPVTNLVVRGARIEYAGGGKAEQATQPVRPPGVDVRPLPAWGVFARNVEQLTLEDVRLSLESEDLRPALMADRVQRLSLDGVRFPKAPDALEPLAITNVEKITIRESSLPSR